MNEKKDRESGQVENMVRLTSAQKRVVKYFSNPERYWIHPDANQAAMTIKYYVTDNKTKEIVDTLHERTVKACYLLGVITYEQYKMSQMTT